MLRCCCLLVASSLTEGAFPITAVTSQGKRYVTVINSSDHVSRSTPSLTSPELTWRMHTSPTPREAGSVCSMVMGEGYFFNSNQLSTSLMLVLWRNSFRVICMRCFCNGYLKKYGVIWRRLNKHYKVQRKVWASSWTGLSIGDNKVSINHNIPDQLRVIEDSLGSTACVVVVNQASDDAHKCFYTTMNLGALTAPLLQSCML